MCWKPRMLEPSKPKPSVAASGVTLCTGTEKCCQPPMRSTNLTSSWRIPASRAQCSMFSASGRAHSPDVTSVIAMVASSRARRSQCFPTVCPREASSHRPSRRKETGPLCAACTKRPGGGETRLLLLALEIARQNLLQLFHALRVILEDGLEKLSEALMPALLSVLLVLLQCLQPFELLVHQRDAVIDKVADRELAAASAGVLWVVSLRAACL